MDWKKFKESFIMNTFTGIGLGASIAGITIGIWGLALQSEDTPWMLAGAGIFIIGHLAMSIGMAIKYAKK